MCPCVSTLCYLFRTEDEKKNVRLNILRLLFFAEVSPQLMAFSVYIQYLIYQMFGACVCTDSAYVSVD